MKRFIRNTILFCLIVLIAQIVLSFDYELDRDLQTGKVQGLHMEIPEPYEPSNEILSIQQHQKPHDDLGFLWKPDIDTADQVVVAWGDIPAGAISTDRYGFANSQSAIEMLEDSIPVDIVGVGASYMGGAGSVFHEYMGLNGLFYYSMAHGRFTLPQYNIALKKYALPLKPRWIIYGMNEVSFTLIPDFEEWKKSDLNWFKYHSGTWCGPAAKTGFLHDQLKAFPRLYDMYVSFVKKLLGPAAGGSTPGREELMQKSVEYIVDAWRNAKRRGAGFIVLLIPSKVRMVQGPQPSLYMFEELVPRLENRGVPFIDLRENFAKVDDPMNLYFHFDAHWNSKGVYRAAREVIDYINRKNKIAKKPGGAGRR